MEKKTETNGNDIYIVEVVHTFEHDNDKWVIQEQEYEKMWTDPSIQLFVKNAGSSLLNK